MLMEQTLHTLKALRLPGMATAFEEQQHNAAMTGLSFDERFSLLVDREHTWRENRRLTRLLREARLKSAQACVEDIRYGGGRQLDKSLMAQLATCQWIHQHQNLVLTGATGCGKTWLACAFGNAACRQGLSVAYVRTPRLFEELRIAHGDGSFGKRLAALAKQHGVVLVSSLFEKRAAGLYHNTAVVYEADGSIVVAVRVFGFGRSARDSHARSVGGGSDFVGQHTHADELLESVWAV